MNTSAQFLAHVRQYAALESQLNADYSGPILTLAEKEQARLMNAGLTESEARDLINLTLAQNVKRFPVQMPTE